MDIKNAINIITTYDTFEGFSSIKDRYLNGDCETLALFLAEKDKYKGEILKIRQDYNGIYNHYIYKKNNLFYDINGEHSSILELMSYIDYLNIDEKFSLEKIN